MKIYNFHHSTFHYIINSLQIFETERIASKSFSWHRTCFSCVKCSKPLSATINYNFEGPDEELYCKTCFKRQFPNTEPPMINGDTTLIKPNDAENGCPRCGGAVFQVKIQFIPLSLISFLHLKTVFCT